MGNTHPLLQKKSKKGGKSQDADTAQLNEAQQHPLAFDREYLTYINGGQSGDTGRRNRGKKGILKTQSIPTNAHLR